MAASASAASWLSFGVTFVGLGSLFGTTSQIIADLDAFQGNRSPEYLGIWYDCQPKTFGLSIRKPPPNGPEIKAGLSQGFCGRHQLFLSRLPLCNPPGQAGWAVILAIFHANDIRPMSRSIDTHITVDAMEKSFPIQPPLEEAAPPLLEDIKTRTEWKSLKKLPLIRQQKYACVTITRTTLVTLLALTNARATFTYSDASGYRAGYPSYNGQWYINWPIGQDAMVRFVPHDSHSAASDVYPPCFPQRVDRCAQMVAGVIVGTGSSHIQVAFCGRKDAGEYLLEHTVKGFPGAHGSRHLYNMLGGKVYEVDYMFARTLSAGNASLEGSIRLTLPSKDKKGDVHMYIPPKEQLVLAHALDCLPWNHLSWSIHRGLRDILVAYARPVMDEFRSQLAHLLETTVNTSPSLLDALGWNPRFVRESMADMAASAVLAGQGNSGDLVRVVTDIVRAMVQSWSVQELDEVTFWRLPKERREMNLTAAVALTKVFVLEWSNLFDYQMYHELPITLNFG